MYFKHTTKTLNTNFSNKLWILSRPTVTHLADKVMEMSVPSILRGFWTFSMMGLLTCEISKITTQWQKMCKNRGKKMFWQLEDFFSISRSILFCYNFTWYHSWHALWTSSISSITTPEEETWLEINSSSNNTWKLVLFYINRLSLLI